jgi:hypothetical protein
MRHDRQPTGQTVSTPRRSGLAPRRSGLAKWRWSLGLPAGALVVSLTVVAGASSPPAHFTAVPATQHGQQSNVKSSPDQSNGAISGIVSNADGSLTLEGICVSVDFGNGGTSPYTAVSGPGGTYTLSNVPDGNYFIRFDNYKDCGSTPNPDSWVTQWYDQNAPTTGAPTYNQATSVSVMGTTTTSGINADMASGGSIQGNVTGSESGQAGICVVVDTGQNNISPPPIDTVTTTGGSYVLNNLAPGPSTSYVIRFDNNNDCGSSPNPGSWITQWYNPNFANGSSTFAGAQAVPVPNTTPVTGIDAVLLPGAEITGEVLSAANGSPIQGICVVANPFNQNGGNPNNTPPPQVNTNAEGEYAVINLSSGQYTVNFNDCQGQPGSWVAQSWESSNNATAISVTAPGTAANIDAALVPGGTIEGTVSGGGAPLQNICASVEVAQSSQGGPGAQPISGLTNSAGMYQLTGLKPGSSYVIQFENTNSNGNCFGATNPGSWVTTTAVADVQTATTVTGVNATMAEGGSISGSVASGGSPEQGICVSVWSGPASGASSAQAQTGGNGSFTVNNVPAGSTYKVRFDGYSCDQNQGQNPSDQWVTQWYNGSSAGAKAYGSATHVAVTAGDNTSGINANELVSGASSISGFVSAAAGNQALGAICVSAYTRGGVLDAIAVSGNFFNNNENYILLGLSPNNSSYDVRFASCSGTVGSWVTQWYNDAASQGGSSPVAVTASTTTANINAAMVAITEAYAGPNSGTTGGGTVVTLSGTGFTGTTAVTFGGLAGTDLSVISDSILQITTPAHRSGTVPVIVHTPNGDCPQSDDVTYTYTS